MYPISKKNHDATSLLITLIADRGSLQNKRKTRLEINRTAFVNLYH